MTETQDDNTLRADDNALLSLDNRMRNLDHEAQEMRKRRDAITHKLDMIRRVQRARSLLAIRKIEVIDAIKELESQKQSRESAKERLRATDAEKEDIAARRRAIEAGIRSEKEKAMTVKQRSELLASLQRDTEQQQKWMEKERDDAIAKLKALGQDFREKGFEQWITYNSESLPKIVKGTILKLTPIAGGLESVADANNRLTEQVTARLHHLLPTIRQSPFYEGILFYFLLLCPTVVAAWLILKVHARLSQLSVAHYVVAINLYFGTMSVLCLFMSLLSHSDILIVFRHRSPSTLEAFMLLHALLFVLHLALHAVIAYVSKSSKDFGQLVSIFCVGLHFFVHAYKRTILNQDPNIGAPAYFLYAVIFLYTLYDRGITIIEAAVNDDKTVSRASFATYAPPGTGPIAQRCPESKKMVYFAGLPVFSSPHSGPVDDAKSI